MIPFHALNPEAHNGRRVRIGDREGRLSYSRNPQYKRLDVREWYLLIPNERFGEVAMSTYTIQPNTPVKFLDEALA